MQLIRLFRHLILPHWWVQRSFSKSALGAIEQAISTSEQSHRGELRFVVEASLPMHYLLRNLSPRERAIELFSELRVWDTEDNSGVLIYLQLIDRRVEILADRGIHAKVGQDFWDQICRRMESAFQSGQFGEGTQTALNEITQALSAHFPSRGSNPNELPDKPLLL
jgi:uncharacterized membrane protein